MTHMQTLVRNYVEERLMGATDAQDRVAQYPLLDEEGPYPVIGIYTPEEKKGTIVADNPEKIIRRIITLHIECAVKTNEGFATELDSICEQVEALIDPDLNSLVEDCDWVSRTTQPDESGESTFIIGRITYNVTYQWTQPINEEPYEIANLETIHGKVDMFEPNNGTVTGPDGQIDSESHVTNLYSP